MSNAAKKLSKFVKRAPRYTVRASDKNTLRFAPKDETQRTISTQFLDVSMSGVAFVVEHDLAPALGETLKMEIPLGEDTSIAWWAKVTRIEQLKPAKYWIDPKSFTEDDMVFVAVTFLNLPEEHLNTIHKVLLEKFEEVARQQRENRRAQRTEYILSNFWRLFMYFTLTAFTVWFLWYFTLPDANYDAKKGAPWGERYKFFNSDK